MKNLKALVPDVLLTGGAAAIAYGAWLAWAPAGFLVGGALAIATALKLEAAAK